MPFAGKDFIGDVVGHMETANREYGFPRCRGRTKCGRQCWKAPGHDGPHLVLPVGTAHDKSVRRIIRERRDVPINVLIGMLIFGQEQ